MQTAPPVIPSRLPLVLAVVALPLLAQSGSPFDAARLVPRTDSFTVTMQGRPVGAVRETIERTADGFRLTSVQSMGGMSQSTEVFFSRTLSMRSVKQTGQARGQDIRIDVTYGGGRAKGSATTPGAGGMKTVTVDTVVPNGAVDDNLLQGLLHTLPLAAGKTFTIAVFASGQGETKPMTVQVSGEETITVPAGTFEAWKLDVRGGQVPVIFWVSKADPRVIKLGFAGAPIAYELVK